MYWAVHRFPYLRYIIMSNAKINKEVENKLEKTSSYFGRLYKYVWYNRHLERVLRLACINLLSALPSYMTPSHCSLIVTTYVSSSCSTSAASTSFSTSTGVTTSPILKSSKRRRSPGLRLCNWSPQLPLAGHVSKIILCGELDAGYRDEEAIKKRFKDSLKISIGAEHTDHLLYGPL